MSLLTTCYGPDIEALGEVAATLGVLGPLGRTLSGIQHVRGGLLGLHATALGAFEVWQKERALSPAIPPVVRAQRARVRQEVLLGYAAQRPDRLWAIDEPAPMLAHGACFERGPATHLSGRAFLDDTSASYFHTARTGKAQPACGWEGPVFLSLGTYPWVYGGRLQRTPPGLDWDTAGSHAPAAIGMRLCASLWQPEGNLQQDARAIVFAYRHYRQATDRVLQSVPPFDARIAAPGELYRRGLLLHAEQASLEVFTLRSHLGPLAANAHNYVIRRFAAFFALRRALLLNPARLTAEQQRLIRDNADPCLRPYAPKDLSNTLSL